MTINFALRPTMPHTSRKTVGFVGFIFKACSDYSWSLRSRSDGRICLNINYDTSIYMNIIIILSDFLWRFSVLPTLKEYIGAELFGKSTSGFRKYLLRVCGLHFAMDSRKTNH